MSEEQKIPLDHPCKQTCSGWKQGYERGAQEHATALAALRAEVERLKGERDDWRETAMKGAEEYALSVADLCESASVENIQQIGPLLTSLKAQLSEASRRAGEERAKAMTRATEIVLYSGWENGTELVEAFSREAERLWRGIGKLPPLPIDPNLIKAKTGPSPAEMLAGCQIEDIKIIPDDEEPTRPYPRPGEGE